MRQLGLGPGGAVLEMVLRAIFVIAGKRFRLDRALNWYQDGLGTHYDDPLRALAKLSEWETDEHTRARVEEILCRAFLADLRAGFSPSMFQIYKREENVLVLLDDADSKSISRFIDILAAQRRKEWDPLLIVGTASTRAPAIGQRNPERWTTAL